jgi:hypothetical protein
VLKYGTGENVIVYSPAMALERINERPLPVIGVGPASVKEAAAVLLVISIVPRGTLVTVTVMSSSNQPG